MPFNSNDAQASGFSPAWKVILYAGIAVAILDIANAIIFWFIYRGTDPIVIFQSIASGLLGRDSFDGGISTGLLGAFLQFFISSCIAAVFYLGSLLWPALLKKPALSGGIYGIGVYLFMNYIVVPLSQASPAVFRWPWFITNFLGHILLVGMPVAFIARWVVSKHKSGW